MGGAPPACGPQVPGSVPAKGTHFGCRLPRPQPSSGCVQEATHPRVLTSVPSALPSPSRSLQARGNMSSGGEYETTAAESKQVAALIFLKNGLQPKPQRKPNRSGAGPRAPRGYLQARPRSLGRGVSARRSRAGGAQLFLRSWWHCARPRMGSMWLGRKKLSLTLRAFSRGPAGNEELSAVGRSPRSSRPGALALRRLPRCCRGRCGGSGQVGAADALRFNSSISRNSLSGSISDNLGS